MEKFLGDYVFRLFHNILKINPESMKLTYEVNKDNDLIKILLSPLRININGTIFLTAPTKSVQEL